MDAEFLREIECWKMHRHEFGMCFVEFKRLQELLIEHSQRGRADSCFTHNYEIRIRGSGIGNCYCVLFDGKSEPIDITHHEHA